MPNIILKKTFKIKPSGFQVANEKSFSFHGEAVTNTLIQAVNQKLASIKLAKSSKPLDFYRDEYGHYKAEMNHDFQKYHEEDAVCVILDVMESQGYSFRFQYDAENYSAKMTGSSFTSREMFIFTKTG